MRIITADALKQTNPKCKINTNIVNDGSNPKIEIMFCRFSSFTKIVFNVHRIVVFN